ncbi:MAG: PHP domain-containing protein [Rikenellaceae bacterium]
MKKTLLLLSCAIAYFNSYAQYQSRQPINFPKVGGYEVLKADFHTHTIFSDGQVTPSERIVEAYNEGLDAVAITDHLEIQRNVKDVTTSTNRNRSYELTIPTAEKLDIISIKGCEITRVVQPGHSNAIFIKDAEEIFNPTNNENPADAEGYEEAVRIAKKQGGFIFYNHPFHQLADDKITMPKEVKNLIETGDIEGIEVINGDRFCQEGYDWAMENNLTIVANSDAHSSMPVCLRQHDITHRAMTLVLAKERTPEAILEALRAHRTIVRWRETLIGREELVKELVSTCLPMIDYSIDGRNLTFKVKNISSQKFRLEPISTDDFFIAHPMVLSENTETIVSTNISSTIGDEFVIRFRVVNAWSDYQKPVIVEYTFRELLKTGF